MHRSRAALIVGVGGVLCLPAGSFLIRASYASSAAPELMRFLAWHAGCADLLLGCAMICLALRTRVAVLMGGSVAAIGSALFAQLLAGTDLGMSRAFVTGSVERRILRADPPALAIALVILLAGFGAAAGARRAYRALLLAGIAGAAVGSAGIAGMLLSIAWATAMGIPSLLLPLVATTSFAIAGGGLGWHAWKNGRALGPDEDGPWIASMAATAAAAMSLCLWQAAVFSGHRALAAAAPSSLASNPLPRAILLAGLLVTTLVALLARRAPGLPAAPVVAHEPFPAAPAPDNVAPRETVAESVANEPITSPPVEEIPQRPAEVTYETFFQGAAIGLYRTSPSGQILEANPALVELLRFPDLGALRSFNAVALFVDPAARAREQELLSKDGFLRGFEMKVMRYDNTVVWLRDTCRAVRGPQGEVLYYEGTLEDITEWKRADEQLRKSLADKDLLLKEVHHRVKNNLQVISSLLSLQSGSIQDPETRSILRETENRVKSMAMVHERLYQSAELASVDFAEYLHGLVSHLFRAYASSAQSVTPTVNVRISRMGVDEAVACGLIVNELVSNSLKYAFPDGRSGSVRVSLEMKGRAYQLTVSDNGIGLPEGAVTGEDGTLGLQLVRTLADQLRGAVEIGTLGGTEFRITFPERERTG